MSTMLKTWLVVILLLFGGVLYGLFVFMDGKFGVPDLPNQEWIMGAAISGGVLQFLALLFAIGIAGRKEAGTFKIALIALLVPILGVMAVSLMADKRPELPTRAGRGGTRARGARA